MMQIFGAGVAVSLLLCVPPWPFLQRHQLTWLQKGRLQGARSGEAAGGAPPTQGKGRAAKGVKRS
jgi:hypothetical protein